MQRDSGRGSRKACEQTQFPPYVPRTPYAILQSSGTGRPRLLPTQAPH
jgi:hypothetical protein